MEVEDQEISEPTEPCWPFWGLLIYWKRPPSAIRPNYTYPLVSFYSREDEFFNRFDQVADTALEILADRTIDDLELAAQVIQEIINSSVDAKIYRETEKLVRSLCEGDGYQLNYLPEGSSKTEADIRELLKNWDEEWDDDSGLTPRDCFNDLDELSDSLEHHDFDKESTTLGMRGPYEHEYYAVLALMIICNAVHLNRGAQRSQEYFEQAMALGKASIDAVEALALAERIQLENRFKSAAVSKQPAAALAAEIEKLEKERKAKLKLMSSANGAKGGKAKSEGTNRLKAWALGEAKHDKSSDVDIAAKLSGRIPKDLAKVSKDPERLIYDAILAARKRSAGLGKPATRNG